MTRSSSASPAVNNTNRERLQHTSHISHMGTNRRCDGALIQAD